MPPPAKSTLIFATEHSVARYRHYFRRDDLYRPVSEVAARLAVSDVAFAKLCRRAEIPVPAMGLLVATRRGRGERADAAA